MNDVAPLPPEVAPRGRWVGRGLLLLALAATAWVGWREYDHRAAIREAPAAGCTWQVREPIALIRADWRAAFQKETWTKSYWSLNVGEGRELASLRPLLLRLRPTMLIAPGCKDANLDALQGLTSLKLSRRMARSTPVNGHILTIAQAGPVAEPRRPALLPMGPCDATFAQ